MRYILTIGAALAITGAGQAQFPNQSQFGGQQPYGPAFNPNNFMPNIFNPQTQPLSPYLNLLRGNPGANYYFGVRPGTLGMGGGMTGRVPFLAGGGNRTMFFPQLASAPDPLESQMGPGDVLPPAGHPAVFQNTMGFFPSPYGQAGGSRPALSGLGARRK